MRAMSIVRELQQDALNPKVRVSDLLRKALVVARKLGVGEFEGWIDKELSGYPTEHECPAYRQFHGEVKWRNQYHPWINVVFGESPHSEPLSKRSCGQSVGELEALMADGTSDGVLCMPFSSDLAHKASRGWANEMALFVPQSAVAGVLDTVRTIVLKWALKLEEEGIFGEGLSFSLAERKAAARVPTNITNFFGPVQTSQIQQSSEHSTQTVVVTGQLDLDKVRDLVAAIKGDLAQLDLPRDTKEELSADIATVEAQLAAPKPKPSVIRECLQSARRVFEGAGGSLAAQLAIRIGSLFAP